MLDYEALFEPAGEGGFVVTFPDFGRGVTQEDNEAEAIAMAVDLLIGLIGDCIEEGEPLPVPRKHRGKHYKKVRLPALVTAKTELYRAFTAAGIRKSELARLTGIGKTNIDRLFNLRRSTRMEHIEKAFAALGKQLLIAVGEAA